MIPQRTIPGLSHSQVRKSSFAPNLYVARGIYLDLSPFPLVCPLVDGTAVLEAMQLAFVWLLGSRRAGVRVIVF